jgi:hypothetical protein
MSNHRVNYVSIGRGTRGCPLLTKLLTAFWPSSRTGRGVCHKSKQQMEKDEKNKGRFANIYNVGNILAAWYLHRNRICSNNWTMGDNASGL